MRNTSAVTLAKKVMDEYICRFGCFESLHSDQGANVDGAVFKGLCDLIHLIPKWRPINYSFVCMLISPLRLVNMYKKQKNFEVKMRRRGLINMQTKE